MSPVHHGSVVHIWDHYVIMLRAAASENHVSLYSVSYSPELGLGTVLILRRSEGETLLLADDAGLGRRMGRRLRSMGSLGTNLPADPKLASFSRESIEGGRGFRWVARSDDVLVEATWSRTSSALWVEGPAPTFWDREDIWAGFIEAELATISVDGRALPGAPYEDDAWRAKLGRPLSSAHAALAEVRLTPASAQGAPVASGQRLS